MIALGLNLNTIINDVVIIGIPIRIIYEEWAVLNQKMALKIADLSNIYRKICNTFQIYYVAKILNVDRIIFVPRVC